MKMRATVRRRGGKKDKEEEVKMKKRGKDGKGRGEDGQEMRSEMVPPRDAGVPAVPARCPTAGTAGSPG